MNIGPKAGPLVAELLSGITALLIIYFAIHGPCLTPLDNLSNAAIVVLVLLAWILGTFFDLIRNMLEWVWDSGCLTDHELNWKFFFSGDEKRLANLEHYFWSFYILDADMAIAIAITVLPSPYIAFLGSRNGRCYMWFVWLGLLMIAFLFANDAKSLRHEIKGFLDAEPK